jgi:hypothetical protein
MPFNALRTLCTIPNKCIPISLFLHPYDYNSMRKRFDRFARCGVEQCMSGDNSIWHDFNQLFVVYSIEQELLIVVGVSDCL